MPRPKREPCQYASHRGHDWRLKSRNGRRSWGLPTCGICHPPAEPLVDQDRVLWVNGGGPATPERTVHYLAHARIRDELVMRRSAELDPRGLSDGPGR